MNQFFVYGLFDPTSDQPFYIGKGSGVRPSHHLGDTLRAKDNPRRYHKIKKLRAAGIEPEVKILEDNLSEEVAYQKEDELIRRYGRKGIDPDGILTNLILGAQPPNQSGVKRSDETKAKMSAASKGKPKSEEHRKALSKSRKGKGCGPRTDEHRAAISAGQQRTYHFVSPEGKAYTIQSAKLQSFCKNFSLVYGSVMKAIMLRRGYKGWTVSRS